MNLNNAKQIRSTFLPSFPDISFWQLSCAPLENLEGVLQEGGGKGKGEKRWPSCLGGWWERVPCSTTKNFRGQGWGEEGKFYRKGIQICPLQIGVERRWNLHLATLLFHPMFWSTSLGLYFIRLMPTILWLKFLIPYTLFCGLQSLVILQKLNNRALWRGVTFSFLFPFFR